ncbi:MAG: hypothetical protein NTZ49_05970 [Candidatus Parcubacteria bacterium]|nr:hypothetical protein [Candidatus Parcubacteria bacterium]
MQCPQCGIELQPNSSMCQGCGSKVNTQPNPTQQNGYYAVSKKNKTIGVILIIAPFAGLIFILVAYAITQFIINAITQATI